MHFICQLRLWKSPLLYVEFRMNTLAAVVGNACHTPTVLYGSRKIYDRQQRKGVDAVSTLTFTVIRSNSLMVSTPCMIGAWTEVYVLLVLVWRRASRSRIVFRVLSCDRTGSVQNKGKTLSTVTTSWAGSPGNLVMSNYFLFDLLLLEVVLSSVRGQRSVQ